jgi:polyhydroxybutyrate depolymerase
MQYFISTYKNHNHKTITSKNIHSPIAMVLAMILASCTSVNDKPTTITKPAAKAETSQNTATDLRKATPATGLRQVTVKGTPRSFILYIPKRYNPAKKTPLIIDYHGLFGNGEGQMQSSGYRDIADSEGVIVAFPNGIDSAWNIGPCCTLKRDVDDVAFARAIVTQVQSEVAIDESRIYATGFSNGGGMAQYLACHAADLFAAIAPSAFDLLQENSSDCTPSRPIPVLVTRGLKDNFVSYAGGASNPPNGIPTTIHFLGATATFNRWSELNQCTDSPVMNASGCELHKTCAEKVEVGLCSVPEGGHTPGDAKVGWEFLKRFSKK